MSRTATPAEAFEHGDPKRYRRGCRCRPCITGVTQEVRRRRYLRNTGRGGPRTPDKAAAHIEQLRLAGMVDAEIMAQASVCPDTFYRVSRREGSIRIDTEARILCVQVPAVNLQLRNGNRMNAAGTVRRLRALAAHGWSAAEIARRTGKHKQFIVALQNGVPEDGQVRMWVATYVKEVYSQLSEVSPESAGLQPSISQAVRNRAAAKHWAPPTCWDDDTIDDQHARPEWTGRCGTDRGYHLHKIERIPMCPPCEEAHQQWRVDHADLKGAQLRSALASARGRAAGRGAALAENARELLAQEYSWEAVASRLGAESSQIAAAMRRYPAAGDQQMEMAA